MVSSPCNHRGDLNESNQNVVVGSEFSSYIGGEVNMGWRHVKVLLEGKGGICLCKLIFEVSLSKEEEIND